MKCSNENLILSPPWLKEANPVIDWGKETLSLDDKVDKASDLLHQHKVRTTSYSTFNPPKSADPPTGPSYYDQRDRDWLFIYNDFEEPEPYTDRALVAAYEQRVLNIAIKKWPNNEYIRKVNVATELAQEAEQQKPKPVLPLNSLNMLMSLTNQKMVFYPHHDHMIMQSTLERTSSPR